MASQQTIEQVKINFTQHFINNNFVDSVSNETFDVYNPASEQLLAKIARGNANDVALAVEAAKRAFDRHSDWRSYSARQRGELLFKLADLINRDLTYIARLQSLDNGKIYEESVAEIEVCILTLRFYAGAADKVNSSTFPVDGNFLAYTRHEPIGVCCAITPWNYPTLMAVCKLAPCFAMGNTLVLKPSEEASLAPLYIASLVKEAGFPPGVFNIINGTGTEAGQPLVEHEAVRKIVFTGSTKIGKQIQALASETLKRVTLELGGKSPFIVFPDADLDHAIDLAHAYAMTNQGQCCIGATRTFVHESIYDEFVSKSVEKAKQRIVGNPLDEKCNFGPVINKTQYDKIINFIQSAISEGAKLECGGKRPSTIDKGYYIEPTVFSNVIDSMRIAREEIFGPVQSILKFSDIEEVIERANNTAYGLGAAVFTKNIGLAFKVEHSIEAGQVFINNYNEGDIHLPFGGFKQSGIGREFGMDGLDAYRELKAVVVSIDPVNNK